VIIQRFSENNNLYILAERTVVQGRVSKENPAVKLLEFSSESEVIKTEEVKQRNCPTVYIKSTR